jgi:dihydrolipoamide dehydrogenase
MSEIIDVRVPDLGGFSEVSVIEVLVAAGDSIAVEQPLITLETDKATMDVPAPAAGTIVELLIARGDKVSTGSPIARLAIAAANAVAAAGSGAGADSAAPREQTSPAAAASGPLVGPSVAAVAATAARYDGPIDRRTQLLVLGAGPGGYAAAFRAADLGVRVTLVERWPTLGGVCLNVGCIPSKALLHAAKVIEEAASMAEHGILFGEPRIDLGRLRGWKNGVVRKLTGGLKMLAKQRKVELLQGEAKFVSPNVVSVTTATGAEVIAFEQCIVAAGSEPVKLPFIPDDPRVIDSTGALELESIPGRMLVIGGGIIGLEMACVYDALGAKVSVVELTPQLMPGCDPDLVRPLERRISDRYERVLTGVKVTGCEATANGLRVRFEGEGAPAEEVFDRVLVAVGRVPNGRRIGAEAAGLEVDARGFITVDRQMRTRVPHIFAIGDIAGQPMLAHKATHEGKVAAEVVAGHKAFFDARVIPSVAYTDPEVAWVGLTESEAKARGIAVQKGLFPWMASGRSLAQARDEGFTKLLFDPTTKRVLGGGLVGPNAGELVAEIALAVEMGADAADIGLTIHPHPTLSETVGLAAEAFEGTLTDLYVPRRA